MEPPAVIATLFMRFQENVSRALERNFQNSSAIAQKGRAKKATLSRNEVLCFSLSLAFLFFTPSVVLILPSYALYHLPVLSLKGADADIAIRFCLDGQ